MKEQIVLVLIFFLSTLASTDGDKKFIIGPGCRLDHVQDTSCHNKNKYTVSLTCPKGSLIQNQSSCCIDVPKQENVTNEQGIQRVGTCTYSDCFPQDSIVICKAKGNITMAQLRIGDQILAYSKEEGYHYSKVTAWLHKIVDKSTEYLKLTDSSGSYFHVSELHSLALENGTYEFARNVGKHKLFESNQTIDKIESEIKRGVYAPLTYTGNFFVVKSDGQKMLAHCLTNLYNPQKYEWFFKLASLILPTSGEYTYPLLKLAQSEFLRKIFVMFGLAIIE